MLHVLVDFAAHGWSVRQIVAAVFTTFPEPYRDTLTFLRHCMQDVMFCRLLVEVRSIDFPHRQPCRVSLQRACCYALRGLI